MTTKIELKKCECGEEATITLSCRDIEVFNFCKACFKRAVAMMKKEGI